MVDKYLSIAKAGGNLVVKSSDFLTSSLISLAKACKAGNSSLTIVVDKEILYGSSVQIAKENPGKVTFNFAI